MGYFIALQGKRFKRNLAELGIPIWLVVVMAPPLFFALSKYLFVKTSYAATIYVFIAATLLMQLGATSRIDHLRQIFAKTTFRRLRWLENGLLSLPFVCYLLYESKFSLAGALIGLAILYPFVNARIKIHVVLPTPFRRFPFEFIVGFRRSVLLLALTYYILIKAVQVDNANLGLVALGLTILIGISYYFKPEHPYFVWIYRLSCRDFLIHKVRTSLLCVSILTLPMLVVLAIAFPQQLLIIVIIQSVGFVLLATAVLAKYSAFPREMSLPQALLFALSLWFPPVLLLVVPIFYRQAVKRLNDILIC